MHTKLTNHPLEQVIAAIHALNLEPIRLRVMDAELGEGWTREYAESVERAYRNYLTMLVKHPEDIEDIAVSKDVDEFWHTHILHTMKYTEDCEKVFGKYLHHNPHVGARTPADIERKAALAERTWRLFEQEFRSAQTQEIAKFGELQNAAFCNASIGIGGIAFCNAAIGAKTAAFCNAGIKAEKAAFCNAAVTAENAAFCNATVKADNAAFCNATIKARDAAFCNAGVRVEKAAFCNAAVTADNAAFCNATVKADTAFSNVAIKAENAAF